LEEERKISKYSSGINIIVRLDSLWKDTHRHSREGAFSKWNSDLDRIWLELARDYSEGSEEWKDKKEKFDKFEKDITTEGGFHDFKREGFEKTPRETYLKREKVYKILMDKQLFLARLENELGKGTTHDDGDEDDFD
jgi:hypothetical protein